MILAVDLLLHALADNYDAVIDLVSADPTASALAVINTVVALGQIRETQPGEYRRSLEWLGLDCETEAACWQVSP